MEREISLPERSSTFTEDLIASVAPSLVTVSPNVYLPTGSALFGTSHMHFPVDGTGSLQVAVGAPPTKFWPSSVSPVHSKHVHANFRVPQ